MGGEGEGGEAGGAVGQTAGEEMVVGGVRWRLRK